MFKTE